MRFLLRSLHLLRFVFLLITLVFATFYISSAQFHAFTPAADNNELLGTLLAKYEQRYQHEISNLPRENKKDLEALYKQRWDNVKEVFDNKELYTSAAAIEYLNKLVEEIVSANPDLEKRAFSCYFSRSGVPNASYIGEGIIMMNMGLFSRLDNESQAAFVLCHEIAHFYLNHSDNSIQKYVNTLNSAHVQKELHKINNREYNKQGDFEKLLKGLTFDTRRHSRDHESEADSMAVEFMRQSRFDVHESITTLALLDSIDIDTFKTDACLKSMFDAKEYPFQNKWIAKEEGLLGGHAQLKEDVPLADSLKTHPDCKTRIKVLENILQSFPSINRLKDVVDKTEFNKLKNDFGYEVIEYAFIKDNYTRSLYYTIKMLQNHPADEYLVTQVGKVLNGLYTAEKTHTLGKVSSLPSPWYPSNYNLLLQFVQNLYKEDFTSISYHFLQPYHSRFEGYAPYKKEYNYSLQISQQ